MWTNSMHSAANKGVSPIFNSIAFISREKIYCRSMSRQDIFPGLASSEKVNWSTFNFTATSREHTLRRNAQFCRKSLPKSEKIACF
jgi:hypothetical protein